MWLRWSHKNVACRFPKKHHTSSELSLSQYKYHDLDHLERLSYAVPEDQLPEPISAGVVPSDRCYILPTDGRWLTLDLAVPADDQFDDQRCELRVRCEPELFENKLFLSVDLDWQIVRDSSSALVNKLAEELGQGSGTFDVKAFARVLDDVAQPSKPES